MVMVLTLSVTPDSSENVTKLAALDLYNIAKYLKHSKEGVSQL